MSAVPEDFDEFVAARWRELYAVATATTGAPESGARATASALASLGGRWARTTADGAPTAAARAALLEAALAAPRLPSSSHPPAHGDPPDEPDELDEPDDPGTDDRVRAALGTVLAEATPTARAALAAQHWWDEGPALVAAHAHADVAAVAAELAALHAGLAAAHAAALGRDGHELAWTLPAAVADLLEHQADAAPVADPVALVELARARSTRRRRARLTGAGAGLALVAAAAFLAWPALAGSAHRAAPPASGTWASVASWSPRGPLVADPTVTSIAAQAQAADPTSRLLFAGPVGDTIALVLTGATPADPMLSDGIPGPAMGEGYDGGRAYLRLWSAPSRLGTAALRPAPIDGDPTARTGDLVALSVEQDTPATPPAVLVMTRPAVADVFVTTGLLPQPDGSRVPEVLVLPLVDGVASHTSTSAVFTPRIAVEGYSGPPAGAEPRALALPTSGPAVELADAQRTLLAGLTGHAADSLETTSVLEGVVPPRTLDADVVGTAPGPLRVTVVSTFTPDGGRVRTSRLAGPASTGAWTQLERLVAVPSTDPHALLPLPTRSHPGFVAVAPDGATAQLLTLDGRLRDSVTVRGGLATVSSTDDPRGTTFRLRVLAPDGHVVYDAVPPRPDELLD